MKHMRGARGPKERAGGGGACEEPAMAKSALSPTEAKPGRGGDGRHAPDATLPARPLA
jgi:hypothetical protein